MADPFQNVDAAGAEFIRMFADSMDVRQADPTMERIVAAYLDGLSFGADSLTIEVGAGAGAVSRRIAGRAAPGAVIGFEPSAGFVEEAWRRCADLGNLRFEQADGTDLPLEDGAADHVILHTVLSHVTDPAALVSEASRVLKPGGALVLCDADFSKAALGNFPNDPLDACARAFVAEFVTDAHIVSKLRQLIADAGLSLTRFDVTSRVVTDGAQMQPWVDATTNQMVERGEIGAPLREALLEEYQRRASLGSLYGYQAFATAIGQKT